MNNNQDRSILIKALLQAEPYPHPVESPQLIETHISWVILTGDYVYKIKKPVNLGFLDFSSLDKRKHLCEEEIRLNRRLAPNIYLDVVIITGSMEQPRINGDGTTIEYAVKMSQFPQAAQLDRMLERGELQAQHMDALARYVADFHTRIPQADAHSEFGEPSQVFQPITDTLKTIRKHVTDPHSLHVIDELDAWCQTRFSELHDLIVQRKADGYVRECHGDMHLRNLAWIDEAPLAFDCIEFNPNLIWNDVISEIAFLIMDLDARGQSQLAIRFINTYLQQTGDYAGVRLLRFYLVYRALVRAMVDAIRLGQDGIDDSERAAGLQESHSYLQLALDYSRHSHPCLLLTRGLSGSGKTTLSQPVLEQLGAIRIRSDVERKRMFGLKAEQSGREEHGKGMYSADATKRTYHHMADLAAQVLDGGYTVIIDATFQRPEQRQRFYELGREKGFAVIVLEFAATADTLRQRIQARKGDASDADLNILEQQLDNWQALEEDEQPHAISIDTEKAFDPVQISDEIRRLAVAVQ